MPICLHGKVFLFDRLNKQNIFSRYIGPEKSIVTNINSLFQGLFKQFHPKFANYNNRNKNVIKQAKMNSP
jgi:hypothetical protein